MKMQMNLMAMTGVLIAGIASSAVATEVVYTFDGLTAGTGSEPEYLAGQDNWQPFSNHDRDQAEKWNVVVEAGENTARRVDGSGYSTAIIGVSTIRCSACRRSAATKLRRIFRPASAVQ